jgi:hypothetical protein
MLSAICHLVMVLLFFGWISKITDRQKAMWSAILLSALAIQYNIVVRNYGMSNLFNTMLFIMTADMLMKRKSYPGWQSFAVALLLPFVHFFNVIILALTLVFVLFTSKYTGITRDHLRKFSLALLSGLVLFLLFYFQFNETGRTYQSLVNEYWREFAQRYYSEENHYLAPFSIRYAVIENTELLLRLTGTDLRDTYRSVRIQYLIPYCFIALLMILTGFKTAIQKRSDQLVIILYGLFIITGFIAAMNLLYYTSGHAISLNNQWYSSPLYIMVAALFALSLTGANIKQSIALKIFTILVILNVTGHSFNRYIRYKTDPVLELTMDLTEKQLR